MLQSRLWRRPTFNLGLARCHMRPILCQAVHNPSRSPGRPMPRPSGPRPRLFSQEDDYAVDHRPQYDDQQRPGRPARAPPFPATLNVPKSLEALTAMAFPNTLSRAWELFLEIAYAGNHFPGGLSKREAFQDEAVVKKAVLHFARLRPDVIFTLQNEQLEKLAKCFSLEEIEKLKNRKNRNAFKRFVATYGSMGDAQQGGAPDASLQDLLRVMFDLSACSPTQLERVAPGAGRLSTALMKQVLIGYFSPALPENVEKVKQQKAPKREAQASAGQEHDTGSVTPGQAAGPQDPATKQRLKLIQLIKKSQLPVMLGDWFCGTCGVINFKGRQGCWRCKTPSTDPKCMHTDTEALIARYGDPKGFPRRNNARYDKNPAQPEAVREERRIKRTRVLDERRAAKERRKSEARKAAELGLPQPAETDP